MYTPFDDTHCSTCICVAFLRFRLFFYQVFFNSEKKDLSLYGRVSHTLQYC